MALEAKGSNPFIHPFSLVKCRNGTLGVIFIGLSPSGKAQHFDCCIPGPNPGSPVSQMFSSFGLCHLRIFHLHGILLSPHSGMLLRAVARLVRFSGLAVVVTCFDWSAKELRQRLAYPLNAEMCMPHLKAYFRHLSHGVGDCQ